MCDTWDVGNLRQAGLGLPAETAGKDRPEAWASTFGLTIARPQSRSRHRPGAPSPASGSGCHAFMLGVMVVPIVRRPLCCGGTDLSRSPSLNRHLFISRHPLNDIQCPCPGLYQYRIKYLTMTARL